MISASGIKELKLTEADSTGWSQRGSGAGAAADDAGSSSAEISACRQSGGLLKMQDLMQQGWGVLTLCISNKLPDDAEMGSMGHTEDVKFIGGRGEVLRS